MILLDAWIVLDEKFSACNESEDVEMNQRWFKRIKQHWNIKYHRRNTNWNTNTNAIVLQYADKGRLDEGSSAYIFIKDAWMKDHAPIFW